MARSNARSMQNQKRTKRETGAGYAAGSKEDASAPVSSGTAALYGRLRLALDSFSYLATHYYSTSPDVATKAKRVKAIERRALELQRKVMSEVYGRIDGCPRGMKDCGGSCIPIDHDCIL